MPIAPLKNRQDETDQSAWASILGAVKSPFHLVALVALVLMTVILAVIAKTDRQLPLFILALVLLAILLAIAFATIYLAIRWSSRLQISDNAVVQKTRVISPDDGLQLLLAEAMEAEPTDLDIVGYSVHSLLDVVRPLVRRSLKARKRVRILVLSPDSFGLTEKSVMEQVAQEIDIATLRARNQDHIRSIHEDLCEFREKLIYQLGLKNVLLETRLYNQVPLFRGVYARGLALLGGTYLLDLGKPGRELPHYLINVRDVDDCGALITSTYCSWFDYLWQYRSRIAAVDSLAFDLYGTLLEVPAARRSEARMSMARMIGVTADELDRLWLETQDASNNGMIESTTERFSHILTLVGRRKNLELATQLALMEHELLAKYTKLYPEALETLDSLHQRGYKIAVLTNCSPSVIWALRGIGLERYLDAMYFSFEMKALKPAKEVYEQTITGLASQPEHCVFIGDGENDEIAGAKAVGMKTVLLSRNEPRNKQHGADFEIRSLDGILDVIERITE